MNVVRRGVGCTGSQQPCAPGLRLLRLRLNTSGSARGRGVAGVGAVGERAVGSECGLPCSCGQVQQNLWAHGASAGGHDRIPGGGDEGGGAEGTGGEGTSSSAVRLISASALLASAAVARRLAAVDAACSAATATGM